MQRVRYAVIGCGEHAIRGHVIPGNDVPELTCVGAYDPDPEAMIAVRDARREPSSFSRFGSEGALLADRSIDAVVIASPDRFHAQTLHRAVRAGKHVLCDKPLAETEDDLRLLVEALDEAESCGVVVTSCHPRRFDPPYRWLASQVQEGTHGFGRLQHLDLDFSYHEPSKVGLHAGLLADHFNHEFDLLHFACGHAPATVLRLLDGETRYLAVGTREDGIAFSFHGTRLLKERHYREFVRARFERGDISLNCTTGSAILHDHETGTKLIDRPGKTDYAVRFRGVMVNFAAAALRRESACLTRQDLIANAESCVRLTRDGRYDYRPL